MPSPPTQPRTGRSTWPDWVVRLLPGTAQQVMYVFGAVEILATLIVAVRPRYGAWYDIALRDFGLMLAALTLGRLASVYDRPDARL